MAPTAKTPWLKVEHTGDQYEVHWRVERQSGPTTIVDLGHSQSFATDSEAQRWCAVFASALAEEAPQAP